MDDIAELHVDGNQPLGRCYACGGPMHFVGVMDLMDEPDPYQSFAVLVLACQNSSCYGQTFLRLNGHDAEWINEMKERTERYRYVDIGRVLMGDQEDLLQ